MSSRVCPICNGKFVLTADGTSTSRRAPTCLGHKQEVHTCAVPKSWPGQLQWNPSRCVGLQDGQGRQQDAASHSWQGRGSQQENNERPFRLVEAAAGANYVEHEEVRLRNKLRGMLFKAEESCIQQAEESGIQHEASEMITEMCDWLRAEKKQYQHCAP